MIENIITGLVVIAVGAFFSVLGYQLARYLIPIWAFFLGLVLGAVVVDYFTGDGFFGNFLGFVVGVGAGLGLALIAYRYFTLGLVIFAASVGGILIGAGLLSLGVSSTLVLVIAVIAAALVLGALAYYYNVGKYLVVLLTSAAGASAIVQGLLLVLGIISVYNLNSQNALREAFSSSILWPLLWLVLIAAGFVIQIRYTAHDEIMGLPEGLQDRS